MDWFQSEQYPSLPPPCCWWCLSAPPRPRLTSKDGVFRDLKHRQRNILVPSATRLRRSLTSSPGRTKKLEFLHWLTKNGCAAEIKIIKLYASHFTSGLDGGKLAKQMSTTIIPDRSEGIVKVSAYSK